MLVFRRSIAIQLIIVVFGLTACSSTHPIAELEKNYTIQRELVGTPATSVTENLAERILDPSVQFTVFLNCSAIQPLPMGTGPTWRGITIGSTYYEELGDRFPDGIRLYPPYQTIHFGRNTDGVSFDACISDRTIYALWTHDWYPPDYPVHLQGWIDRHGPPALITWGFTHENRAVVWPEAGVMAFFYPDTDIEMSWSSSIILFPYMSLREFENSGLYAVLPQQEVEQRVYDDEEILDLPDEMRVEDPFSESIEAYLSSEN